MQIGFCFPSRHSCTMATYKEMALAYLRDVSERTKKSASELAGMIDVSPSTFTRPLNSATFKYAPKFQNLLALSKETGVPLPPELIAARQGSEVGGGEVILPIRFEVAAGPFLAIDEQASEPFGHAPAQRVSPYEEFPQWLERVVGDSANVQFPHGTLLHVVDAIAIRYTPRQDDWVIVERRRAQGALVERTVKQVGLTDSGVELWPRSYNPRWSTPIPIPGPIEDREETDVLIVGRVLRGYFLAPS